MLFGGCKCCAILKEEVQFLRSLVRPKPEPRYDALPTVTLEADALISGAGGDQVMVDRSDSRQEDIESERARILSGEY